MTPEITADEANSLFSDISKAMREDDSAKLNDLLTIESSEESEEQPPEEVPSEEEDTTEQADANTDAEEQTASSTSTEVSDPVNELRKEIEQLKKAQQSFNSQAGRVPSIQRRLAEYDKQLAELSKATSSRTSTKIKPQIDTALKDLEESDPLLANTIRDAITTAITGVDEDSITKEATRLAALRELEYNEYVDEQRNILLDRYPNAMQVFQDNHWSEWKKSQPEHILNLATSDNAQAVIMALDLYRNDMLKLYPELNTNTSSENVAQSTVATRIEEERKKKQTTAANINSGNRPASSKPPADADALFRQYSEEIRKERMGG